MRIAVVFAAVVALCAVGALAQPTGTPITVGSATLYVDLSKRAQMGVVAWLGSIPPFLRGKGGSCPYFAKIRA